ncbi:hypothetical protein PLICRDRAFT_115422 [Plicaturopsis crispa FD-325 SS-3]|nr:hypothetical protein PLICRDRAFT_115422 [Plicaturopsis crispa FD-325 SS-3]
MSRIGTKLTRLLDLRLPIVSACMANGSGGALAGEVTAAGGLGFLAIGYRQSAEKLKGELELARRALSLSPSDRLPIGVGALGWLMEEPGSNVWEQLTLVLDEGVKAVWLSCGRDLGKWINLVREHDRRSGREPKTAIFAQIGTVEQALVAVNDWKVDVVVAQGSESGGHGYASAPPLNVLIPSILAALPDDAPPILAAGGLSNGAQVAAMLTLGASGAVLGTRFLATPESLYSEAQKQALVSATATSTLRSMAFDRARGTMGWPDGIDGRGIRNKMVDEAESGASDEELMRNASQRAKDGDLDGVVIWAGAGVGLVDAIKPAQEIVRELRESAVKHLEVSSALVVPS